MIDSKKALLHLVNMLNAFLPATRFRHNTARLYGLAGLQVGKHVAVLGGTVLQSGPILIGDETWIGTQALLIANPDAPIIIGRNVAIAARSILITGTHDVGNGKKRCGPDKALPIEIGDGSWIGLGTIFVAGSGVGKGVVVGAGSVVTKKFGDNVFIAGVPARVVRDLEPGSAQQQPLAE